MNFLDLAKSRYSVRNYNEKKVESEKLNRILEAAHVAPTAANLQPVRLLVVQEENGFQKLQKPLTYTAHPWQSLSAAITPLHGSAPSTASRLPTLMLQS